LRRYLAGTPKYYAAAPAKAPGKVRSPVPTDGLESDPARMDAMRRRLGAGQAGRRADALPDDSVRAADSNAARDSMRAADSNAARDSMRAADSNAARDSVRIAEVDSVGAAFRALTDARQLQAQALAEFTGVEFDAKQMDRFLVEIYKKYSIPVACLVFVLIGAPLGMMARRGGFGVGAGLSLGFFLFYWACLIGGEKLADRGALSPFWGMWVANIILGIMGILLTIRVARESRVIDWSVFTRFVPKSLRGAADPSTTNPRED
ncbi:MAG: LptF/LptG family permease, partial [Bacteroidota bacterium]|nr:LptF/LptG family permease [Bacteroidota bacterium]